MYKSLLVIATLLPCALPWHATRAVGAEAANGQDEQQPASRPSTSQPAAAAAQTEQATFGLGCFSCAEAIFEQLRGVESVDPGYSGGDSANPTYAEVSSGQSGHAEVVHIVYDPKVIAFDELLEVFWKMHDPTTLNRQGDDVGTHYRSAIFYHSDAQRNLAKHYKTKLDASGAFADRVVTEITPFTAFYPAEREHLDFYRLNPENQYCTMVIRPKLDKFKKAFTEKLRSPVGAQADQQPAAGGSSDGK